MLLNVTHAYVAVEAGAVFDLKPADHDVAAEPCVLAQRELVPRCDWTLDLPLHSHVRSFDQDPGRRTLRHVHVACDPELAFGAAIDVHVPVIDQLALEAVVRPHRELALPVTLAVSVVVGRSHRGAFCHCVLNVHKISYPRLGYDPGMPGIRR